MNRRECLKYGIAGAASLFVNNVAVAKPQYIWDFDFTSSPYSWWQATDRVNFDANWNTIYDPSRIRLPRCQYFRCIKGDYFYKDFKPHSMDILICKENYSLPDVDCYEYLFTKCWVSDYCSYKNRAKEAYFYFAVQLDKDTYQVINDEYRLTDIITRQEAFDINNRYQKTLFRN